MVLEGSIDDPSSAHSIIIEKFRDDICNDRFTGTKNLSPSLHVAQGVVKALRDTMGRIRQDAMYKDAIDLLRYVGKKLSECEPYRALIANVSRRVLWITREEHRRFRSSLGTKAQVTHLNPPYVKSCQLNPSTDSFACPTMCTDSPPQKYAYQHSPRANELDNELRWGLLKSEVLSCVAEYLGELEATKTALCKQAEKQVRSDETILTFGHSRTIESFLLAAAGKKKFRIFIAEGCPTTGKSCSMADSLRSHGIDVQVIALSSVFAVIGSVGKIILGTQLVLANGGSLAQSGSQIIALCAKEYNVPVLVISATEKFSPYYPVDRICSAVVKCAGNSEHTWENCGNTESVLALSEIPDNAIHRVDVCHVVTDYVQPELVTLYITNEDSFAPYYAYRLISEWYNPDDYDV